MKPSAFLLLLAAISAVSVPAGASAKSELRSEIAAFVETRELAADVDRTCVIDRAIKEHPKVPLTLVGPPLSGKARELHEANVKKIKIALAVNAAVTACTPTSAQKAPQDG